MPLAVFCILPPKPRMYLCLGIKPPNELFQFDMYMSESGDRDEIHNRPGPRQRAYIPDLYYPLWSSLLLLRRLKNGSVKCQNGNAVYFVWNIGKVRIIWWVIKVKDCRMPLRSPCRYRSLVIELYKHQAVRIRWARWSAVGDTDVACDRRVSSIG
jgi:hypothetical protein